MPIAVYSGLGQTGDAFRGLFGTTAQFDDATLAKLYRSHAAYVRAVTRSVHAAVRAKHILALAAGAIRASASASNIGK